MTQKQNEVFALMDKMIETLKFTPYEYFYLFKDFNTQVLTDSGKRDEIIKSSYLLYSNTDYSVAFIKEGLQNLSLIEPLKLAVLLSSPNPPFTLDDIYIVWQDDEQIAYFLLPEE